MIDWVCQECDGSCQTTCHLKRHRERLATDPAYQARYAEIVARATQQTLWENPC